MISSIDCDGEMNKDKKTRKRTGKEAISIPAILLTRFLVWLWICDGEMYKDGKWKNEQERKQ